MIRLLYTTRFQVLAVLLLMLLALVSAKAQNVVYQGQIDTLNVDQQPGDTYKWELYQDSTVNFATTPGDVTPGYANFVGGNTGPSVQVEWKEPGIYFFKVTAMNASGCTTNLKVGKMKVLQALPTATLTASPPVCEGAKITLEVTLTGTAPWKFTYTDGTNSWTETYILTSPYVITIDPGPSVTTSYTITSVTDKYGTNTAGSNTVIQIINPLPKPSSIYHR